MQHTLVAHTDGSRFVCVDTGNHKNLICDLILYGAETTDVIDHRIFIIRRTWSDDQQKPVIFSLEDFTDLSVAILFDCCYFSLTGNCSFNSFGVGSFRKNSISISIISKASIKNKEFCTSTRCSANLFIIILVYR